MLKTMRKSNIKGFSLVELMVVVAIIGILAAVAIPNFQRFQRRSRQAEGKSTLGSIHQAETVFFQSYDMFYGDLREINVPTPVGTIFYNAGFPGNGADPVAALGNLYPKAAALAGQSTLSQICVAPCATAAAGTAGRAGFATGAVTGSAPAGSGAAATFTAHAIAWIGGAAQDEWTMTEAKVIMQTADGVQ
jgi:prepilin-type N-terminal cleavage/methylation domain-containing protein